MPWLLSQWVGHSTTQLQKSVKDKTCLWCAIRRGVGRGWSNVRRDFLMTKERECITKGSILGTYLIVCLEWIKGWEWTKCHLDELLGSPMQEFNLPEAGLVIPFSKTPKRKKINMQSFIQLTFINTSWETAHWGRRSRTTPRFPRHREMRAFVSCMA